MLHISHNVCVGLCDSYTHISTPQPPYTCTPTYVPPCLARELLRADVEHPDHQKLAHHGEGQRLHEKDPGGPEEEFDGAAGPILFGVCGGWWGGGWLGWT